jgi:RING-H2 zinc finger domain
MTEPGSQEYLRLALSQQTLSAVPVHGSVDICHTVVVVLTLFLVYSYMNLRRARLHQQNLLEAYLQGLDVESGVPESSLVKKFKKRGVSQGTIDQTLCVYSLEESLEHGDDGVDDAVGNHEEGSRQRSERLLRLTCCDVCGKACHDITFTQQLDSCSICLNSFTEEPALCPGAASGKLRVLPCHHIFHQPCVDAWLVRQNVCPLCNAIPCT